MQRLKVLIIWVLSGLFLGSIALLILFFRNSTQGSLGFEVAKSLLQIGVVSATGAVISLLIFEYQQEHQAREKENDLNRQATEKDRDLERQAVEKEADLKRQALEKERDLDRKRLEYREKLLLSILSRAMDAYDGVKTARRILRGRSIFIEGQGRSIFANQYDRFFDMINDAQLDFENLARDVETSATTFSNPDALVKYFRSMDNYLGTLIREYENSRYRFSNDESSLPLSELSDLDDYLKHTKDSRLFLEKMVVPYHEIQRGIRAELLHLDLDITKPS